MSRAGRSFWGQAKAQVLLGRRGERRQGSPKGRKVSLGQGALTGSDSSLLVSLCLALCSSLLCSLCVAGWAKGEPILSGNT